MSVQLPAISTAFVIDTGPGFAAEDRIVEKTRAMAANVDKSMAQAADAGGKNFKGMLKDISGEFGKKSNLGLGLKLLMGGGAIAGVNMAAHMFEGMAGDVSRLADEYRKGDMSGKELFGNILRQIPILGSVTKGFDELREAITGERAEMEKDAAYAKQSEEAQAFRKNMILEAKQLTIEWTHKIQDLRKEWELLTAAPGRAGIVKAQQNAVDVLGGFREQYLTDSGLQTKEGLEGPLVQTRKQYDAAIKNQKTFQDRFISAQKAFNTAQFAYEHEPLKGTDVGVRLGRRMNFAKELLDEASKAVDENRTKVQSLSSTLESWRIKERAASERFEVARHDAFRNEALKIGQAELPVRVETIKKNFETLRQAFDQGAGGVLLRFTKSVAGELAAKLDPSQYAAKWQEAGRLINALRTPAEEIQSTLGETQRLFEGHFIDRAAYQRQLTGARNALLDMVAPNTARLQGEEIGGHKTVTAADQGEVALEQLKQQEATVEGINKLIGEVQKLPAVPKFVQMSVGG